MSFPEDIQQFIIDEKDEQLVLVEVSPAAANSVNDFCRLCRRFLRINGNLTNTSLLFCRTRLSPRCPAERLGDMGLTLSPDQRRSTRICRGCSRTLDNMERCFDLLQRWKQAEREGESPSAADTEPPAPLQPPRKRLRESLPPKETQDRRSVIKVVTEYSSGRADAKVATNREAGIICNVAHQNWKTAANLLYSHKELFEEMKSNILVAINKQCKRLANPKNGFYLYKTSPEDLKSFSFDKLISDLERLAPFLLSIFNTISKNNPDAACASLCIALRGRLSTMSAFAYHVNSIIARGGLKRERAVFNKLSGMAITTSHHHVRLKRKEIMLKRKEMKVKTASGAAGVDTPLKVEMSSERSDSPEADMNSPADSEEERSDAKDLQSLSDSILKQELPT